MDTLIIKIYSQDKYFLKINKSRKNECILQLQIKTASHCNALLMVLVTQEQETDPQGYASVAVSSYIAGSMSE
jgi:hypothetical protein